MKRTSLILALAAALALAGVTAFAAPPAGAEPIGACLADNAIGNPHIIPPGPCRDPFRPVGVDDPNQLDPWLREIDENRDGVLCAAGSRASETVIVLDNPSAIAR